MTNKTLEQLSKLLTQKPIGVQLAELAEVALETEETALLGDDEGRIPQSLQREILRLRRSDLELAFAKSRIDKNLGRYRDAFVEPIDTKGKAIFATTAYTFDILIELDLSFSGIERLVDDIIAKLAEFKVEPTETLRNFRLLGLRHMQERYDRSPVKARNSKVTLNSDIPEA